MTPDLSFNTKAIKPIECLKEAWGLIKRDYWLLFAISLVGGMIAGVTVYVLLGAMICGIMICYLKKIDGGEVRFEDLWTGMKFLGPSIPIALLFIIPIVVYVVAAFFTVYSPLITLAVMGERVDSSVLIGTLGIALAIDLFVAIAMTCIHSLIIFAFPLLVDRGLGAVDAVKLSARAALKNIGGIGGLILLQFGIVVLGELAFCVGIYLTIPILTATSLVAYRKVFPQLHHG
ncbi:MAG: hypothetical protein ACJ72Z_13090 [Pyrinomonadaceae bacterium]